MKKIRMLLEKRKEQPTKPAIAFKTWVLIFYTPSQPCDSEQSILLL